MSAGIKHAFNQAAHTYNRAASVQHAVGKHLIQCLPHHTYEQVLDLGCGTGVTTHYLANYVDFKVFNGVDIASDSLKIASEMCKAHAITFMEGDFNHAINPPNNDLIFSNMALHWADDLKALFDRVHAALNHQGLFVFSLPLVDTFHELSSIAAKRSLPTDSDVMALLKQNFECVRHERKRYQTSHENTLACLRAIKQTGASFVRQTPKPSLTKKILRDNPLTELTYDIGFFIGQKRC